MPILPGKRQIGLESPQKYNNSLSTITEVLSSSGMSKRPSEEELRNTKGNTSVYSNLQINSANTTKTNFAQPEANIIQMSDTVHEKHLDNEMTQYNKEYTKTQLEIERVLYKSKSLLETKKSLAPSQLEKALENIERTKNKINKIEKEFSPDKTGFHLHARTVGNLEEVGVEDEESEEDLRDYEKSPGIRHGVKPKTADFEQMVTSLERD
jgi:hypothetical protein